MTSNLNTSPLAGLVASATKTPLTGDAAPGLSGSMPVSNPGTDGSESKFFNILHVDKKPFTKSLEEVMTLGSRAPTVSLTDTAAPLTATMAAPLAVSRSLADAAAPAQALNPLSDKIQILIEGADVSIDDAQAVPVDPAVLASMPQGLPQSGPVGGLASPRTGNLLPPEPAIRAPGQQPPAELTSPDAIKTVPSPKPAVALSAPLQEPAALFAGVASAAPVPEFADRMFRLAQTLSGPAGLSAAMPGVPATALPDALAAASDADGSFSEIIRSVAPLAADRPNTLQPAAAPIPLSRLAGAPGWDQGLGQRILWMVDNGLNQAELRLDPPNLGSVNVRISVQDDQAQLMFQAAHPAAREALESALPRLREMFAQQGLELGSTDISDSNDGAGTEGQAGQGERTDDQRRGADVGEASQPADDSDDLHTEAAIRGGPLNATSMIDEFV